MLLAAELALIAIDPETGRPRSGTRDELNASLAGLLVAEHALDPESSDPLLVAAGDVVVEKRSEVKAALSHMSRALQRRVGRGTWDAVVGRLVDAAVVAVDERGRRRRYRVLDVPARDAIVAVLRTAAAGDDPLDPRTAALLAMTGPAQLLEVVAPDRAGRAHARRRIDHALDESALHDVAESVRGVLAEAAAAVAAVGATTAVSAGTS